MGLLDFLKGKTDKEKKELLMGCSSELLRAIANKKRIDITGLRNREDIINAILEKPVSKKFLIDTIQFKPTEFNVRRVIDDWKPKKFQSESAYRDDLYLLFKEKFGDEHVRKGGQYNPDIVISDLIPIELKYNFSGKAERNRLEGQIADYKRNYNGTIFLVICGIDKMDDAFGELKQRLLDDRQVEMIVKFE